MLSDEIGRTFFLYMDLIGKNPWPIVDVFWWKLHDPRWERVTNKQIKTRRWVAIRCVSQYVPYGINVLVSIIAYSRYISAIHVQWYLKTPFWPLNVWVVWLHVWPLCFDDLHISMAIESFDPFAPLWPTEASSCTPHRTHGYDAWTWLLVNGVKKINNRSRVNRKKHSGNFSRYVNLSLSLFIYV